MKKLSSYAEKGRIIEFESSDNNREDDQYHLIRDLYIPHNQGPGGFKSF